MLFLLWGLVFFGLHPGLFPESLGVAASLQVEDRGSGGHSEGASWREPATGDEAVAFVYHRFGDPHYPSTNIDLAVFEAQLDFLAQEGFAVLPLGEVVRRLRTGEILPPKTVVLTIDDAYQSFWTGGFPLLERYGFPATLFVSPGTVGRPGYLSWDQIRELESRGIEIGNHSYGHDYLLDRHPGETRSQWRNRIRRDLLRAQAAFRRHLGYTPTLFAYPYGEYDPDLIALVRELGFVAATAQQSGVIHRGGDLYTLPRFPMGGPYATLEGFQQKARMRALPVARVHPVSPVIQEVNPPRLEVFLAPEGLRLHHLRCFVNGDPGRTQLIRDPDHPARVVCQARMPLFGRRNKYTLTASTPDGRQWYWFSQIWIRPWNPTSSLTSNPE